MFKLKVRLRDWISERFHRIDHVLVPSVPLEKFAKFVRSISPVDNGHHLRRMGPPSDGSYLLPDDLREIALNISPGVGKTFQFEKALLDEFQIPSIMLDASVESPINLPKEIEFVAKFVFPQNNSGEGISINELVTLATVKLGDEADFMLQMDIEGAEYEILKYIKTQDLLRFRILAIEFHDMELWVQNAFYSRTVDPIFSKLLEYFDVVHSRSHNSSHTFYYKGFFIPSALELTFHRKDRSSSQNGFRQLPSVLDYVDPLYTSQKTPFSRK
ncbi:Methyltransferase FkbM [Candidatus Nanopelagicaceae bacterium]|jgi:hypothetical protein